MRLRQLGLACAAGTVALAGGSASAQPSPEALSIELNRLAVANGGCELALVVTNESELNHDELRAELVLFDTEGLIGRRASADLGPADAGRTVVRTFLIPETDCAAVGRVLINDFTACADAAKTDDGRCRPGVAVSSRAEAELVY